MKTALISGRAAVALIQQTDETWFLLRYDESNTLRECHFADVELQLRSCDDVQVMVGADLSIVRQALVDAVELTDCVDLTLWLLDEALSDEARLAAATELDEAASRPGMERAWADLFWSRPMPAGTDISGALRLAQTAGMKRIAEQIRTLQDEQPSIAAMRAAWLTTLAAVDDSNDDFRHIEGFCVRNGVFRAVARDYHESKSIAGTLSRCRSDVDAVRCTPKWTEICDRWGRRLDSAPPRGTQKVPSGTAGADKAVLRTERPSTQRSQIAARTMPGGASVIAKGNTLVQVYDPAATLARRIEQVVHQRVLGLIRGLRVEVFEGEVVLSGHAATYYAKQLATHAALDVCDGRTLVNEIEVS